MNQHKFSFRVGVLILLIAVMAGIFGVRLYDVQVTQASQIDHTPSGSHTYRTRVTAARGEILDRNGKVLIGNRASYNLTLIYAIVFSAENPNENLRKLTNLCNELELEMTDHVEQLFQDLPGRARLGQRHLCAAAHPPSEGHLSPPRRLDGGGGPARDLHPL